MKNAAFYRLLHARGLTTQRLALEIRSSRAHVTQVLNNIPGRGGQTRRKLRLLLTPAEILALDWPT
jgi:hypothetical protein